MKILNFKNETEWLEARRGRITGSRLEDVLEKKRGTGKKVGFYELIAERISLPGDGENPMDRGHRLEDEALDRFEDATGKNLNRTLMLWLRDEQNKIAVPPDAFVSEEGQEIAWAVEAKCLSAAKHIEICLTKEVPSEYDFQVKQYFIVAPSLQKVTLCFYNPLLKVQDFFMVEYTREQVQVEIDALL